MNDVALFAMQMAGLSLFSGLAGYLHGAVGGGVAMLGYLPAGHEHRSWSLRISRTTSTIQFEVGWIDRVTLWHYRTQ